MKLNIKAITSRFTKIFKKSSSDDHHHNRDDELDEDNGGGGGGGKTAAGGINVKVDYDFHQIDFNEIVSRFGTSLKDGLTTQRAQELLAKNGKNMLSPPQRHLIRMVLSYLFSGFCGVLWIASLICFLAWKPIGDPPDPTNLGLAILLNVVIRKRRMMADIVSCVKFV